MSVVNTPLDETRCPLCGEDNACLNAYLNVTLGGSPENNCWCNDGSVSFPAELIAQVPNDLKHKACICRSCVEKHLKK